MSLFQLGDFTLSSGEHSSFKIDCDALSKEDIECIAWLLSQRLPRFGSVEGVPTGGDRLAAAMQKYVTKGPVLIVDDVWTTGASILKQRGARADAIGGVIFARRRPISLIASMPVFALFTLGA